MNASSSRRRLFARIGVCLAAATFATATMAKVLGTTTFANGHCMVASVNNGQWSYVDLGVLPTAACTFVDWLVS